MQMGRCALTASIDKGVAMFKKILVVIDEMPVSQAAIQLAHTLAVVHAAGRGPAPERR